MLKRIKRMKLVIISSALAALMLCGWTAYASTSSSSATSTTITGVLTSLTADTITLHTDAGDQTVPLASSIWVYLNDEKAQLSDLKTGEKLELILNNKKQAAYVKGSSETGALAETAQPSKSAIPTEQPTQAAPIPSAPVSPAPYPTKPLVSSNAPKPTPSATPSNNQSNVKELDVSVDGLHFNLHIRQSLGAHGPEFELTSQTPHAGKIHLTGDQAKAWISQLLGSVDLTAPEAQKAVGQRLAKEYDLDANKLNVHLKMALDKEDKDDKEDPRKDDHNKDDHEKAKVKENDKEDQKKPQQHGNSQKHN